MSTQKDLTYWLSEYSRYHVNPLNKKIHWVCVPVIMMTLLGLLWSLPVPEALGGHSVARNWLRCILNRALTTRPC